MGLLSTPWLLPFATVCTVYTVHSYGQTVQWVIFKAVAEYKFQRFQFQRMHISKS